MKINLFRITRNFVLMMLICPLMTQGENLKTIDLPAPQMEGGMPLMQALKERQSGRSYEDKMLPPRVLSNLLWAAFGVNRPETGQRTAPSAMNWQELDIYVVTAEGAFLYDALKNQLKQVLAKDIREMTGQQPFVKTAPVNLIFVSDYSKMKGEDDGKKFLSGSHAGFVSQNVYLFCASEGLATVIRASADRVALAKELGLPENKRITLIQTVGYPKKR